MSLSPNDLDAIARVFRSEVLASPSADAALPLPLDSLAEATVASAAMNGEHDPDEIGPVAPEDFHSKLLGAVWGMCCALVEAGRTPSVPPVLAALKEQGFTGSVESELVQLRDSVPSVSLIDLREYAQRVIEISSRRRLVLLMYRLNAQLRTDAIDWDGAAHELTEFCNPSTGGGWDG